MPRRYGLGFVDQISPRVVIKGDAGIEVEVAVSMGNDGRYFFTEGWQQFAAAERIVKGDVAVFALVAPRKLSTRLYYRNGRPKPMMHRPFHWQPQADVVGGANSEGEGAARCRRVREYVRWYVLLSCAFAMGWEGLPVCSRLFACVDVEGGMAARQLQRLIRMVVYASFFPAHVQFQVTSLRWDMCWDRSCICRLL